MSFFFLQYLWSFENFPLWLGRCLWLSPFSFLMLQIMLLSFLVGFLRFWKPCKSLGSMALCFENMIWSTLSKFLYIYKTMHTMTPRQIIYIYTLFYLLFFQLIRFLVYDLALLCHYILTFVLFLFFFWLRWIFVAVHGLSLVPASGGYSSLWCVGFSLQWLLLLQSMGSRHASFSSCGIWAQSLWLVGSREQAQ